VDAKSIVFDMMSKVPSTLKMRPGSQEHNVGEAGTLKYTWIGLSEKAGYSIALQYSKFASGMPFGF
jgi:hypothetical protein